MLLASARIEEEQRIGGSVRGDWAYYWIAHSQVCAPQVIVNTNSVICLLSVGCLINYYRLLSFEDDKLRLFPLVGPLRVDETDGEESSSG